VPDYRYLHYDVFTSTALEGNALAVFPDAAGLTDAQMQAIAREMAFSETTFVLPAEAPGTDVRMRIFTPGTELPIAGHPTVGSTFALVEAGLIEGGRQRWTFGLGVGPTPVDLEWEDGRLAFAWMTQPVPVSQPPLGDAALRSEIAAAVGLADEDLDPRLPVQVVSVGVPFTFIPVRSRAAVDRARPDLAATERLASAHGLDHYYLFTMEAGEPAATTYSRMFAPALGIIEDPATGGACGPLGAYLLRHGLVHASSARSILNLQGAAMGRPSWIRIDVETQTDEYENVEVRRVRVGGQAVPVASGTLHL
jgi:trans-2,3-dihydro-3-hydroxyanthranilate isomerase